ncbi:glycosyltransferase [Saccharicrinis fermentans]|uniref:PGL/P-HBAD biosynthesis glycosyltransferase/MT3031 n=1 Tax=Saccharicrinis fermentans DSM 9555 = JCM 21142 TaxID=869213 RepID=W7Y581_9BACT|nr:glycosyltransferase [Saccharicrinis fermentans]GAF03242.1 PGL/P-HBAD biosynthesis glycosyltransferase/MT3031 [Saccharicrinis fermentans DSM 9555 = JCM 21142]
MRNDMKESCPLVSIVVSTFNSSKFIIETLESFKWQTYPNIELIVGDDASSDNTVAMVKDWLAIDDHEKCFQGVKVIEGAVNIGVSANANRSLKEAAGQWIKFIGADDVLLPNCIQDNMAFVEQHKDIKVLFSKVQLYQDTFEDHHYIKTIPGSISEESIMGDRQTARSQYEMLLYSDRIHFTPSVFLHRDTLRSIGGFDERFKLLEDYPLWLNLTKNNHKLYFMNAITVNYRRHSKAINNNGNSYVVNLNYFRHEAFRKEYTYPYLPKAITLNQRFIWYASQLFRWSLFNKRSRINLFLYDLFTFYANPFSYYLVIKRRLGTKAGIAK